MYQPIEPQPEPTRESDEFRGFVDAMCEHLEAVKAIPGLDRFRELAALPESFFTHFRGFLAAYDKLIDFALEHDGDERRVKCTKGCANCCIDLVRGMTTPEIINIYNHVRTWPDAKQLFEYHRESAEKFSEIVMATMKPGDPGPTGQDPRVAEAHVKFNKLNRPCGFLDQETGLCRIYPVRPVACRYFFSLDEPENCSPLHVKYLNRRTRTVHLPDELHALLRDIDHAFGFRPMNYLSGAFCQFTAQTMRLRVIKTVSDDEWRELLASPPGTQTDAGAS